MARIIVDIRDDIAPVVALECVRIVVSMGRISKNATMYCYDTSFNTPEGVILVLTRDYRKSDCFIVCKDKRNESNEFKDK